MHVLNALTIAGFDSSGGAGVLADALTFSSFGYRPAAVITSITFQSDSTASGAIHQSAQTVNGQLTALTEAFKFACVKIGMLPTSEIVRYIGSVFRDGNLPAPVVDPVMVSSSGMRLMELTALESFVAEILPVARLVTPNIHEAESISHLKIQSEAEMREAAKIIRSLGARAVLIKGGHLPDRNSQANKQAIDLLDDDGEVAVFRREFIPGAQLRGSGCRLSSAIAAGLGKGKSLEGSIREAKDFVLQQLKDVNEATARPTETMKSRS